ncbi:MAG: hypothetical protein ACK46Z_10825 [Bacteroidota bacterium]
MNIDPTKTETGEFPAHIPPQLMEKWLQLIHRACTARIISYRERMQLLWLYLQVEKRYSAGMEDNTAAS